MLCPSVPLARCCPPDRSCQRHRLRWAFGAIAAATLAVADPDPTPAVHASPFAPLPMTSMTSVTGDAGPVGNGGFNFQVPIVPTAGVNSTIYLKIPGIWNYSQYGVAGLCITIVERPQDCSPEKLQRLVPCAAQVLWSLSSPSSFLGFQLPRPTFTTGEDPLPASASHSVCLWAHTASGSLNSTLGSFFYGSPSINPVLLGSVIYYPMPSVRFESRIERIGVRTFLNPGWQKTIHLSCSKCSASSRIGIRPLEPNNHCKGLKGAVAAAMLALQNEHAPPGTTLMTELKLGHRGSVLPWPKGIICAPPKHGPCRGYIDSAFSVGQWHDGDRAPPVSAAPAPASPGSGSNELASFSIESHARLAAKDRRHLFHHRSAICFYPDDGFPQGWLAGYVDFHMDGPDVQAFVGFVCFFGIALPLICMVTVLLHVNKQQRCKQHVREMRLLMQREQLERELHHRRNGATRDDGGSPTSSTPPLPSVQRPAGSSTALCE